MSHRFNHRADRWHWQDAVIPHVDASEASIDHDRSRYPYAIVWSPLPFITWLLPFVGHMGICNSQGLVFDFAGPYCIGCDNFAFGAPTRYYILDREEVKSDTDSFDTGIAKGCAIYEKRMHNICCDNCHSHVARCMNIMRYNGRTNWNMLHLGALLFLKGKYVGVGGFVKTWLPFLIFVGIILLFTYGL